MTLNRRRMLAGGSALAIGGLGLVSRSVAAQDATPATAVPGGGWSFTDDKGVTITLPARPERLAIDVNAAAPLWDYGIRPVALFGWNVNPDGSLADAGGEIDVSTVELVGNTTEPIQVEALTAVDPDLVITIAFTDDPTEYWSIDTDALGQIGQRYPILALSVASPADVGLGRFVELATALGADLAAPDQVAAQGAYEAKLAEVTGAVAAKPDLTFLFGYLASGELYLASAPDWSDLLFYQSLGLRIPPVGAEPGGYWAPISNEELGGYPADVLFQSTRPGNLSPEELMADPVFGLHPAVAAGQVFGWNQDVILSYRGMTVALDVVLQAVLGSDKVT